MLTNLNFSQSGPLSPLSERALPLVLSLATRTCSQSGHSYLFSVWPLVPVLSLAISVTINFSQEHGVQYGTL